MRSGIRILSMVVASGLALLSSLPAHAASWRQVRDAAMTQREGRNYVAAYSTASSFRAATVADVYDSQFVSGWIALRYLNRPDVALQHFTRMASVTPQMKAATRNADKAQAGYWLGRALSAAGRKQEATAIFKAAAGYANTFYGQLSAAELGIGLPSNLMSNFAGHYPEKDFYWHDNRARKELVLAVIREESRFRQTATSPVGAKGLMQVMPGTAKGVGRKAGVNVDLGMMNSNPDYNVAVGSHYLAEQITKYRGNAMLAAAAYNAGPQSVDNWLARFGDPRGGQVDPVDWVESIPFRETRDYVKKVIGSYITYMALASNK